jgi:acyl carrier protein
MTGGLSFPSERTEEEKMDELFQKMQKLIAEKLEIDISKITLDSSFRQDLGADSLDTYEMVYAIEEELGVSIPDEKANEFETVRDAYEFIKSQK